MSSGPRRDSGVSVNRIIIVGGVIATVFVLYVIYLFSMQVVDGYIYTLRAEQQTRRSLVITAPRGNIFDRTASVPIATNRDSFAIDINPAEISRDELDLVFERVADQLGMPVEDIHELIPPRAFNVFQPIEIASELSYRTVTSIAERKELYPGVSWRMKPVRYYPEDDMFSHVLGYVGDITPEELQVLYNRGYTSSSVIGKAGIELYYDELLRGQNGREYRRVDAQGRKVADDEVADVEPVQGSDVVLTIDRDIQELTQKALGARIGAAIVLDASNGEILSMVSYPSYDANLFYEEQGREYFTEVSLDPRGSFLNRTLQATESPASTFKVLMTTAIIEEEAFPTNQTVFCPGSYTVGNRVFNCHKQYGHGQVALYEALAESCNVYYYTVGNQYLGVQAIVDYGAEFGLGSRTGIDLPNERSGLLPTPDWKERTYNDGWRPGDTVNLSIGQGFLQVTPLQLASMIGTIVNDGITYRPRVMKEIRDPVTGRVLEKATPEALRTSSISPETFAEVRAAMRGVVENGTPQIVMTTNAPMGGKTGTAETASDDLRHSWFVAFSPKSPDTPDEYIATVVWIDAANEWDWWAPYASNIIVHGIYNGLNYEETINDLRTRRDPWLWYGRGLPE